MDTIELGRKMKEARIAKRMTQNQVVGDFITRNMLSQIESGTATPSIKTLEYLCDILDLSMNELIPGETPDALSQLSEAKQLLASEQYEAIVAMREDYPPHLSDEFSAIMSQAYLALSKRAADENNYQDSVKFAQIAIELADEGIYANKALRTESVLHLNAIAEKLSEYYADLSKRE